MRAWVKHHDGERFRIEEAEVDRKTLAPGEVEIEVRATSLNPVDNKLLRKPFALRPQSPVIPHCDVAGVVAAVGNEMTGFHVGDKVFGCAGGIGDLRGALCEYMIASANLIAPMPLSLNFSEAAALPLVSIAAWEGLIDKADIAANDQVLIHGGAGGVGHLALQLAKTFGGRVATTVSGEDKAEIARQLGADEVIFYKDDPVAHYVSRLTENHGFDIVFDTIGGDLLSASISAAANNGRVVTINNPKSADLTQVYRKGLSLHFVMMLLPMLTGEGRKGHGRILREIAALVDAGRLHPLLDQRIFSFAEANEAHAYFESGGAVGKIVLENK